MIWRKYVLPFIRNSLYIIEFLSFFRRIFFSNSLLNPIVYGRTNKEFKRFFSTLCRQPGRGDEHSRSRASSVSGISGKSSKSQFKVFPLFGHGSVPRMFIPGTLSCWESDSGQSNRFKSQSRLSPKDSKIFKAKKCF